MPLSNLAVRDIETVVHPYTNLAGLRETMKQQPKPRRVAYSATLGITPVDPQVARLTRAAAERLAGAKLLEDLLGLTSSTPIEPRILAERKAKTA